MTASDEALAAGRTQLHIFLQLEGGPCQPGDDHREAGPCHEAMRWVLAETRSLVPTADLDRLRAVERALAEWDGDNGNTMMANLWDAAALGDRAAERCNRLYDHERGIPHGCNGL